MYAYKVANFPKSVDHIPKIFNEKVGPLKRGGSVSSVEIKYFTVSDVDLKNTVSSVDLVQ